MKQNIIANWQIQGVLLKHCNYENIYEYNDPNKKHKRLIVFDMIGDMISNKKSLTNSKNNTITYLENSEQMRASKNCNQSFV